MLICCFAAIPSSAQNTLTVADSTVTNAYVPIYGYYVDDYVKSQVIYPASMIAGMTGQNITAITFYFSSAPSDTWGVTFRIMLKEIANPVFSSEAFVTTSLSDVVYTGPIENESGVLSVELDYPFAYNGGNLLMEISSVTTGDYSSCSYYGIASNMSSMQGFDPNSVSDISPNTRNFIPKTTFEYGSVSLCTKAKNLAASNITSNSATISWTGCSNASSYVVEYMPSTSTNWDNDATQLTTTDTSVALTNLTTGTAYQVRVKVFCSDSSETAWSTVFTFIPGAYTMNNDGYNILTTCASMIYDDGGPNNNYGNNCNSTLVLMPENPSAKMMLSGTCHTESGYDHLYIYDGADTNGTLLADYTGTHDISLVSNSGPLTLVFISDLSLNYEGFALLAQCVSCYPPTNVTVSNTTLNSATITWSGSSNEYAIYLSGATNGYYTTTGNSFTFTGLNPSSMYMVQVRSLCTGDSSILSDAVSFNTSCNAITITSNNPWTEDFESYSGNGGQPYICWNTPVTYVANNGTFPLVYCGYGESCHSGVNSGEFKGSSNMLVLPEFTNNIANLRLSFWATATTVSSGTIEVGYVTDALDATTFVAIANAGAPGPRGSSSAGNGNYMGPFDFNGVNAPGARMALRYTSINLASSWNVDDFTIELSPECPSPVKTSVTATNIDGHNATISWVDNDSTHSSWTVYYRKADAPASAPWLSLLANSTQISITGLDPESSYHVYVVTNCSTPAAAPDATQTITFTTTVACPEPTNLTLVGVTTDEAAFTWSSTASNFNVEYGPAGFTPGSGIVTVAYGNTITLTNLTPATNYTIIVRANCGSNDGVSNPISLDFTTTTSAVSLPYTANFTDSTDIWILNNGICTNYWTTGSVNNVPSLFVTNDGTTPGYDISNFSVVTAEKFINVGEHASFSITFDAIVGGESSYDYLKVFFAPVTESYPANTTSTNYSPYSYSTYAVNFQDYLPLTGYPSYPYKLNLTQNNTIHVEVEMPNPNENPNLNSTAKLVFMWKDDLSAGIQPAAIISNVNVMVNSCPSPTALADSNITISTADIYWTPGEDETEWELEYGLYGFSHGNGTVKHVIDTPTTTLTNLSTATTYDVYVRAICGPADTSLWIGPLSFVTECDIISTYPYTENFDTYTYGSTSRPNCWSFPVTYNNAAPYITNAQYSSSSNSLFFQSSTTNPTTAVSPQFSANINTLRVKFMLKAENPAQSGTFEVGVMSNPNDVSTFESVEIIQPENSYWNEYIVDLSSVTMTGPNRYIAFRQHSNSPSYFYWMDNVLVMPIPSCQEPSALHSTEAGSNSVTLSWTPNGNESSWSIEYGPAGFTMGTGTTITANTNPFTVGNLTAGTAYDFYVRANCSADDQSIWIGPYTGMPGSYNMQANSTDTITACDLIIFDDGGAGQDYGIDYNSTLTIYPTDTISLVTIHGTLNTEACCDYLRIYDGADINGTMFGEYKGTGIIIPELISSTGPITLYFHSDVSIVNGGFELYVSCYSNTCPAPTGLQVTNVTPSSADLSWTPGGTETAWTLEYKGYADTSWTVIPVTTPSYQFTGLNFLTAYDVRVKANCGSADESLYASTTFYTEGCDVTDQCTYIFSLHDSYGDGWNNASLDVQQNGVVVASVTILNGTAATATVSLCDNLPTSLVWNAGDYDNECSFNVMDPEGNVIFTSSSISAGTLFTFTSDCPAGPGPILTDPTVATTAATAIGQDSATLNGTITNPDSVTITAKGFVWKTTEGGSYDPVTVTGDSLTYNLTGLTANTDYTYRAFITFDGNTVYGEEMTFTTLPEEVPQPCDLPTGLHTTSLGGDYITIAWNGNPNVSIWNIQYRMQNDTWDSATSSTNSYTLTGLEPETTYEIKVQGDCGNGNLSEWSTTITATTTVGIENYLLNSISLYPNPANDVINVQCTMNNVQVTALEVFDVYGKLINTVETVCTPSPQTQINVSGLASGMYFVRVTTEQGVATKSFVKK